MKQFISSLLPIVINVLVTMNINAQSIKNTSNTALIKQFFGVVRAHQTILVTHTDSSTDSVQQKQVEQSDTAYTNYITSNYVLGETGFGKDDRTAEGRYAHISRELLALQHFLKEYPENKLIIRPIATGKEGVYIALTPFQQANTQVVLSTQDPKKVLLYLLILPAGTINRQGPRILSWQLVHAYDKYQFEDILGNKGWEVLLEGVKGR